MARKAELAHCAHIYRGLRRASFNNTHFQITEKYVISPSCIIKYISMSVCQCYTNTHSLSQYNFRFPETLSTILTDPGPIPSTVLEPRAIWVRPASHTRLVISPRLWAMVASSSSSRSVSTFSTTLACPPSSHCSRIAGW